MSRSIKLFVICILTITLSNCGYTPIFSNKNVNFNIENIEFSGDSIIEQKINQILSNYKNKPNKGKKLSLTINGSKNRIVVSKNTKGEDQVYKIIVQVKMKVFLTKNNSFEKNMERSSTYSAVESKSEENLIEKKLIENLSTQIAQQIILEILDNT